LIQQVYYTVFFCFLQILELLQMGNIPQANNSRKIADFPPFQQDFPQKTLRFTSRMWKKWGKPD